MDAPTLSVTLPAAVAVVGEPTRVSLHLSAGAEPLAVPQLYRMSDVVSLEVRDDEGDVVAAGDGYAKRERVGLAANFVAQSGMATDALEPGASFSWEETLMAYVGGLAPGAYRVRAHFRFDPAGIDLVSDDVALLVLPHRCVHLDIVSDQVLLAATTFLAQHDDGSHACTFVCLTRTAEPGGFWEGTTLPIPAGVAPRVSEADFSTTRTFAHDFARTVAWVEGGALSFTSFVESGSPTPVVSVPLDGHDPVLVGRPIRHADASFTALYLGGEPATRDLHALHLDPDGTVRSRAAIGRIDAGRTVITAAPDTRGRLYLLLCATPDRPPFLVVERPADGVLTARVVLAEADLLPADPPATGTPRAARLLGARLLVKDFAGPRALLLACVVPHDPADPNQDDVLVIAQAFLDAPPEGLPPVEVRHVILPRGTLARGEAPVAADLARTRGREVHALIATSHGRLLHVRPGSHPTWFATVPPDRSALIALVTTADHDVHAFFASDESGIEERVLERPPRP